MAKILLEMKSITKTFPGVKALDNVNLKVEEGEIHALVGENGAGKSTLMNVLSGIYPYGTYEGDIIYNGEVCKFGKIKDSEEKGIVIIHQELALIPYMTIGENMFLGNERGKKAAIDWSETYGQADKYLRQVGLKESSRTLIKDIGVGKQQLVEIAKALAKHAKLLILDEPTAGLDPGERIRFRNIITEIAKDRMILIATHIVSDVEYIANHIIMLQKGNVICEGTADALRNGIKGQVFSLCVSEEQSKDIQKAYLVSNMKRENDGVYLRVISDHAPEGAKIVEPQLEEVFLSIFKKESDIHENTIL